MYIFEFNRNKLVLHPQPGNSWKRLIAGRACTQNKPCAAMDLISRRQVIKQDTLKPRIPRNPAGIKAIRSKHPLQGLIIVAKNGK